MGVVLNLLGSDVMYVRQAVTVSGCASQTMEALSRQRRLVTRPYCELWLQCEHVTSVRTTEPNLTYTFLARSLCMAVKCVYTWMLFAWLSRIHYFAHFGNDAFSSRMVKNLPCWPSSAALSTTYRGAQDFVTALIHPEAISLGLLGGIAESICK